MTGPRRSRGLWRCGGGGRSRFWAPARPRERGLHVLGLGTGERQHRHSEGGWGLGMERSRGRCGDVSAPPGLRGIPMPCSVLGTTPPPISSPARLSLLGSEVLRGLQVWPVLWAPPQPLLPIPRRPFTTTPGAASQVLHGPAPAARSAPARLAPYRCSGLSGPGDSGRPGVALAAVGGGDLGPPKCPRGPSAPSEGSKDPGSQERIQGRTAGAGREGHWKAARAGNTHQARGRFPGARGLASAPASPRIRHTRASLR